MAKYKSKKQKTCNYCGEVALLDQGACPTCHQQDYKYALVDLLKEIDLDLKVAEGFARESLQAQCIGSLQVAQAAITKAKKDLKPTLKKKTL